MGYTEQVPEFLKDALDAAVGAYRGMSLANKIFKSLFPDMLCPKPTFEAGQVAEHINCQLARATQRQSEFIIVLLTIILICFFIFALMALPKLKIRISNKVSVRGPSDRTFNIQNQSCGGQVHHTKIAVDDF